MGLEFEGYDYCDPNFHPEQHGLKNHEHFQFEKFVVELTQLLPVGGYPVNDGCQEDQLEENAYLVVTLHITDLDNMHLMLHIKILLGLLVEGIGCGGWSEIWNWTIIKSLTLSESLTGAQIHSQLLRLVLMILRSLVTLLDLVQLFDDGSVIFKVR